jgi:hypothetical protein
LAAGSYLAAKVFNKFSGSVFLDAWCENVLVQVAFNWACGGKVNFSELMFASTMLDVIDSALIRVIFFGKLCLSSKDKFTERLGIAIPFIPAIAMGIGCGVWLDRVIVFP